MYSVSQKNPAPQGYLNFFIFSQMVKNLYSISYTLRIPMYARLQIFIQLSPTLTKLCHIKRGYLVYIYIICAKCPKRACSDICV